MVLLLFFTSAHSELNEVECVIRNTSTACTKVGKTQLRRHSPLWFRLSDSNQYTHIHEPLQRSC